MMRKYLTWLLLGLLLLATSWSLLRPGLFDVHDTLHAARTAEMWRGLSDGHFPVRWSANYGYGYGIPLFQFYAPLPYYLSGVLWGLGLPLEIAVKLLFLLPNVLAVMGAFYLGKKWHGSAAGLILAAVFSLAPYRAVNLFVRGAVSESWGMMAFPWILLSFIWLAEGKKRGFWGLLLSLVVLILSHNLTTLLFVPFTILIGFGYLLFKTWGKWQKLSSLKLLARGMLAYILAVGISAFYVVPAFFERNLVQLEAATGEYYQYFNHFLYLRQFFVPFWGYGGSVWGPEDGLSFFLGLSFLGIIGLSGLMITWQVIKLLQKQPLKKSSVTLQQVQKAGVFLALGSLCLFLATTKANTVWQLVPILSFVQFPWRFIGLAVFFLSIFAAVSLTLVKTEKNKWMLAGVVVLASVLAQGWYFHPKFYYEDQDKVYFTSPERIVQELGPSLKEYLPRNLSQQIQPKTQGIFVTPISGSSQLESKVEVIEDRVQRKTVKVESASEAVLHWQVSAYEGWQVNNEGQPQSLNTDNLGLLITPILPGTQTYQLRFGNTPIRQYSDTITLLSLTVTAIIASMTTVSLRTYASSHRKRA